MVEFVDLPHDRGNTVDPRPLCGPPAPLAGDDQIILAIGLEQDRLQNAALADQFGELVERVFVELDPRLVGVGLDPRDVDLADAAPRGMALAGAAGRRGPRRFTQQRLQPHAEPLGRAIRAHAATANCGRRPISSRARRR